jgi:hypothetical protein
VLPVTSANCERTRSYTFPAQRQRRSAAQNCNPTLRAEREPDQQKARK